jgi:hypothetical protein
MTVSCWVAREMSRTKLGYRITQPNGISIYGSNPKTVTPSLSTKRLYTLPIRLKETDRAAFCFTTNGNIGLFNPPYNG